MCGCACPPSRQYKYGEYLPVYDESTTFPPTKPFEFNDRGLVADRSKSNLLPGGDSSVTASKITPVIGTEIRGLQLSQLTNQQRDELALLIAERGVVVFRDQDFKDIGIEKQKEFGKYFGPLHVHVSRFGSISVALNHANPSPPLGSVLTGGFFVPPKNSPSVPTSRTTSSCTTSTSGPTTSTATAASSTGSRLSASTRTSRTSTSRRASPS